MLRLIDRQGRITKWWSVYAGVAIISIMGLIIAWIYALYWGLCYSYQLLANFIGGG